MLIIIYDLYFAVIEKLSKSWSNFVNIRELSICVHKDWKAEEGSWSKYKKFMIIPYSLVGRTNFICYLCFVKLRQIYEDVLRTDQSLYASQSLYHQTMAKVLSNMYYVYVKMNKVQSGFWCLQGVLAHQESFLPPDDVRLEQTKDALEEEMKKLSNDPFASFNHNLSDSTNSRW